MSLSDNALPRDLTVSRSDGRRLRVLYYSHSADVSGAEISLLLTVSHMQGEVVDTVLVAPSGEVTDRARNHGIYVVPVRGYRARMSLHPWPLAKGMVGTVRAGIELRRVVRKAAPDIVHANSIRAGLIAVVGVMGRRTQLVWHVRDNLPNNVVGRGIRTVASWRANKVFAISRAIAANFAMGQRLQRKTTVVHNGIDVCEPEGKSIRFHTDLSASRFVLAVVGQIAPWKRQHDAVQAFAAFCEIAPDSELWIVGEPKFRDENIQYANTLETMVQRLGIADRVRFLGFRTDVANVMASIDVLVVPSENEPFGRVVIEAMLAGKPVIGTRGGGIPEIVMDGQTGYLVETGDTAAMVERLRTLHADPLLAKQMGKRGRTRTYQDFSIESKVEQIHGEYRALILSRSQRGL
ncbi:glycosyltransferase family 4 protein [Alicyclobacillus sp. ALC3]|uniref:glycosyltransferase family 4 protein n=1 Tax=Alicyclobacillus sp. ALC3 TaxID=2796143 RepID=UPI0023780126|nr:glycosyltransferase family 4 protein [Alicyclobacillus sp. ALC3]WDL95253.1 glycosyltransferase family 4 protein [Alicyclobacillus sp. ALC3]